MPRVTGSMMKDGDVYGAPMVVSLWLDSQVAAQLALGGHKVCYRIPDNLVFMPIDSQHISLHLRWLGIQSSMPVYVKGAMPHIDNIWCSEYIQLSSLIIDIQWTHQQLNTVG